MAQVYIYKFNDTRDFDSAYVIATNRKTAAGFLKEQTELEIHLFGFRDLEDFPLAQKHFDKHGEGVWRNNIEPF